MRIKITNIAINPPHKKLLKNIKDFKANII